MGKKRRKLSAAFKQEVLKYIEDNHCTVYAVYKHFPEVKEMDYAVGMYYQGVIALVVRWCTNHASGHWFDSRWGVI